MKDKEVLKIIEDFEDFLFVQNVINSCMTQEKKTLRSSVLREGLMAFFFLGGKK